MQAEQQSKTRRYIRKNKNIWRIQKYQNIRKIYIRRKQKYQKYNKKQKHKTAQNTKIILRIQEYHKSKIQQKYKKKTKRQKIISGETEYQNIREYKNTEI